MAEEQEECKEKAKTKQMSSERAQAFYVARRVPEACFMGQITWSKTPTGYEIVSDYVGDECELRWSTYWIVGPRGFAPAVFLMENKTKQGHLFILSYLADSSNKSFSDYPQDVVGRALIKSFDLRELKVGTNMDTYDLLKAITRIVGKEVQGKVWTYRRGSRIPSEIKIEKLEEETPCSLWDEIKSMDIKDCKDPLTEQSYRDFSQYSDAFLAFMTRHLAKRSGCYRGILSIAVNIREKRAQVFDLTKQSFECPERPSMEVFVGALHFVDFPTGLSDKEIADMVKEKGGVGHAVAIILNRTLNEVEYYDPNGSLTPWNQPVIELLEKFFETQSDNVIEQETWCPVVGPQRISGEGICSLFTQLILLLRLACPLLRREELFQTLLSLNREEMNNLMESFHCYAWKIVREEGIVEAFELLENPFDERNSNKISKWKDLVHIAQHKGIMDEMREYWSTFPEK